MQIRIYQGLGWNKDGDEITFTHDKDDNALALGKHSVDDFGLCQHNTDTIKLGRAVGPFTTTKAQPNNGLKRYVVRYMVEEENGFEQLE